MSAQARQHVHEAVTQELPQVDEASRDVFLAAVFESVSFLTVDYDAAMQEYVAFKVNTRWPHMYEGVLAVAEGPAVALHEFQELVRQLSVHTRMQLYLIPAQHLHVVFVCGDF